MFILSPFSIFLSYLCELFTYIVSYSPGDNGSKLLKIYSEFLRYLSHSDQRYHPITLLISYSSTLLWKIVIGQKNFHSTELFFGPVFICLYHPYRIRMLNMWDELGRSSKIISCKAAIFQFRESFHFVFYWY